MRVSVSLPEKDVELLDEYAAGHGLGSRSAVVHRAVRLLRGSELGPAYEKAWADWSETTDSDLWDLTTGAGWG